jgi:hypothetical protein
MTLQAPNGVCLWCGREFVPRLDGGKRQRVCRPLCRRRLDAAGRRWVAEAIATGVLTVHELKTGVAGTRALVSAATSSVPVGEVISHRLAPIAPRADSYRGQRDLEQLMAQAIAVRRR